MIFYYRRHGKKTSAQPNTAEISTQLEQIPEWGSIKKIINFFNNSKKANYQSNKNKGTEINYDTKEVEVQEKEAEINYFTKEVGAQEVVGLNKEVLGDLEEEITILKRRKRVIELKKEIRDLEGINALTSNTSSVYSV